MLTGKPSLCIQISPDFGGRSPSFPLNRLAQLDVLVDFITDA